MNVIERIKNRLYKVFLNTFFLNRYTSYWYKKLGVRGGGYRMSADITIIGEYSNLEFSEQTEINSGVFLLAKDKITIGENSTLAYQVSVYTSANPNDQHNKLVKVYPPIKKPVAIGKNTWIGARSVILPGVRIGDYCVVAAGSVVNKDVSDYTVVAGVPAKPIKKLNPDLFID